MLSVVLGRRLVFWGCVLLPCPARTHAEAGFSTWSWAIAGCAGKLHSEVMPIPDKISPTLILLLLPFCLEHFWAMGSMHKKRAATETPLCSHSQKCPHRLLPRGEAGSGSGRVLRLLAVSHQECCESKFARRCLRLFSFNVCRQLSCIL